MALQYLYHPSTSICDQKIIIIFHFSKRSISTDANTNIQIQGIPLRPKTNENQNQNTPETNSQSQLQTVLEPESEIMDMDIDIDKTVNESRNHQHQNQNLCNKCGIVFSTDKLLIRHVKDFHSPKRNVIERKKRNVIFYLTRLLSIKNILSSVSELCYHVLQRQSVPIFVVS